MAYTITAHLKRGPQDEAYPAVVLRDMELNPATFASKKDAALRAKACMKAPHTNIVSAHVTDVAGNAVVSVYHAGRGKFRIVVAK